METDEVAVVLAGAVVVATVRVVTVAAAVVVVVVVLEVVWVVCLEVDWADDVGSVVVLSPGVVVGFPIVKP